MYGLQFPVRTDAVTNQTRLLAAVQEAMTVRLDSDRGYAGLLTKNPAVKNERGSSRWSTIGWKRDALYSLTEMLDWVDLPKKSAKPVQQPRVGFGRNVEVFDTTRFWAYSNFANFGTEEAWLKAVQDRALVASRTHVQPLREREVSVIAKSIGRWVWRRRSDLSKEFSAKQSARGQLGGRPSIGQPWTALNISRASYFAKLAAGKLNVAGHSTHTERGLGLKPNQIQLV